MKKAVVRRLGNWGKRAAFFTALYLALASKLTWPEGSVALVSAIIGTAAMLRLERLGRPQTGLLLPPAEWTTRLLGKVGGDAMRVSAVLALAIFSARPARGALRGLAFQVGDDTWRHVGRRTLVTLGNSLAPNSVVIAVDQSRQRLLIHELVARQEGRQADEEWPL